MLKNLTQFFRPRTAGEVCNLLSTKDKKFWVLAGGTTLGVSDDKSIEGLIDLKGLNLSYVRKTPSGFAIGATTPVQDIFKSTVLSGPAGELLRKAAGSIGSTPLRNSITIGGNIVGMFPWTDLPPALMALDASVVISDGKREQSVPVSKLYESTPRDILGNNQIVTEVLIPLYKGDTGVAFTKFAKTKNDYALITVAVRITRNGNSIREARIALNAISRKPQRCLESERDLQDGPLSQNKLEKVAKGALKGLVVTSDIRASKEYRTEILPVLVRRCLEEAVGQTS